MTTHPHTVTTPLSAPEFEALRQLDTCTVSNAIESFGVRLRDEGFADSTVRAIFSGLKPMLGYAVTAKIRCSGPPPEGNAWIERTDWWDHILSQPAPRIAVIQDLDRRPGSGALLGEVHANILTALQCVGAVTDGAVRDLPAVQAMGFHFFARNVAVSHSYVHIVQVGTPVELGGLKVSPGNLIHGDCHGVLRIPFEIASAILAEAARLQERERRLIQLCRSKDFSLHNLARAIKERA